MQEFDDGNKSESSSSRIKKKSVFVCLGGWDSDSNGRLYIKWMLIILIEDIRIRFLSVGEE
jgi:hypothetical protein